MEEYRKEATKVATSLNTMVAITGRILSNDMAVNQIKRMSSSAIKIRELCQQHASQLDTLEAWTESHGIDLYNPPAAPRQPPKKKYKLEETLSTEENVANWCKKVMEEEAKSNLKLKCIPCNVIVPVSYTHLTLPTIYSV